MQKYLYLIIISFSFTGCYTYQVKKQTATATDQKQESTKAAVLADNNSMQAKSIPAQSPAPAPINIQEKLAPNKNVKIDVDRKSYKVIVDRWESDSLVVHPVRNPKKVLKFHKNQINSEKIAEKRFSQPIADIITVTAYAGIGALIWFLVR
ncbi:hypothetical protein ACQ7CX_00045 [Chryseobacterium arthrosphaerae]|uniref:hypothetical protein n=1 Tax=Chryseobacterium arthrosphaerae TaxID=651561 RepID=UPI001BAEACCA|nr:hypothetical protein [Chryseobacterium arthrosphaerae]QUY53687.1 hypothetical protein I2F65_12395 [Chryseobacterium arthrosphaerae]